LPTHRAHAASLAAKAREKLAAEATAALKSARACGLGAPCPSSKKGARMWVEGESGDAAALEGAEGLIEQLRRLAVAEERQLRRKTVDIRAKVSDAIDDPAAAARFGGWLGSLEPECVPAADRNSVFQFVMRTAGGTNGGKQGKKGKKGGDAAVWKGHDGRMLAVVSAMVAKNELFSKANIAELQVRRASTHIGASAAVAAACGCARRGCRTIALFAVLRC
jgi:hypothetical protein